MGIETLLALATMVLANIGTVIGLFCWSTSNANDFRKEAERRHEEGRKEAQILLKSIADEMKDFHGRLERQDAEFRQRFLAIEERRRG